LAKSDILKLLLAHEAVQVNRADDDGRSALHLAADAGSLEAVKELLASPGIDVNLADGEGKTPLHLAVAHNALSVVKLLVECPAVDINAVDEAGQSTLHIAAEFGFYDMALTLCRSPMINVKLQKKKVAWTALHVAARHGNDDILYLLLNGSREILNATTVDGYTAVHLACIGKHAECLRILLEVAEIDPNVKTRIGVSFVLIRLLCTMLPSTGSLMALKCFWRMERLIDRSKLFGFWLWSSAFGIGVSRSLLEFRFWFWDRFGSREAIWAFAGD
jgi:ankyrin repeat protein